jgi:hypothetical protein
VEPGTGGHVEHGLDTACPQLVDEEAAFALIPPLPVDELVPLLDEVVDVLLGVVVGFADLDRIAAELLPLNEKPPSK